VLQRFAFIVVQLLPAGVETLANIGSAAAVSPPHLPVKLDHFETRNAQRCACNTSVNRKALGASSTSTKHYEYSAKTPPKSMKLPAAIHPYRPPMSAYNCSMVSRHGNEMMFGPAAHERRV
jgi:hypothetical protein